MSFGSSELTGQSSPLSSSRAELVTLHDVESADRHERSRSPQLADVERAIGLVAHDRFVLSWSRPMIRARGGINGRLFTEGRRHIL